MSVQEIEDPFGMPDVDDDPFATADDVKAGRAFTPTPPLEALEGRLVVMVPRKFEDDAPVPEAFRKEQGEVRDRYTVDMVVLDGGPLTFEYNGPIQANGERERLSTTVAEFPALFTGVWRLEASIIGQLRKVDGTARPMLRGIVRRGPQAKDSRAGKTFDDIDAAFAAWRKNPKGNPPRFSWQIDVDSLTPVHVNLSTAWWRQASAEGFSLR